MWYSTITFAVPLLQVTLKVVLELMRELIYTFWIIILAGIIIWYMPLHYVIKYVWCLFWLFLLCILARPSVQRKSWEYVVEQLPYLFGLIMLVCIEWFIGRISTLFALLLIPYNSIQMFFLCDSLYTFSDIIRAPWRAAKLSLAIAPWYAVLAIILMISSNFLEYSSMRIFMLVVAPLYIVCISRLYIMVIHKEYKEYYERCW